MPVFRSMGVSIVLLACGGDVTSTTSTGSGAGNEGGSGQGANGQGGSVPESVVVVDHLYVGTKTLSGVEDPQAWKAYGFNLDGLITAPGELSGHCQPAGNAPPNSVFPDGDDGIDNAFGKYLVPILKTAAASLGNGDFEDSINLTIEGGTASWAVSFGMPAGTSEPQPAPGAFFEVRDRTGGTWLKAPEAFSGDTPLATFPDATAQAPGWASGAGQGVLRLRLGVFEGLSLSLHHARVRLVLDPSGAFVQAGQIGGVLDTEAFVQELRDSIGPYISCDAAALDGILNQFRQGSDIMADGTQDPTATCNGISVGLGFSATVQPVGDFAAPLVPPENPCEGG